MVSRTLLFITIRRLSLNFKTVAEPVEPRAKRQKKDKFGRLAALEKFKSLKEKGTKHKYEVNDVDNVYETVDEKEYTKKVLSRQEDDWIVDDGKCLRADTLKLRKVRFVDFL